MRLWKDFHVCLCPYAKITLRVKGTITPESDFGLGIETVANPIELALAGESNPGATSVEPIPRLTG